MKSVATSHQLLFVGESPFYKQVQALTGERYRYTIFLSFSNAGRGKQLLDSSDLYLPFMRLWVAVVEDRRGKFWIHTPNLAPLLLARDLPVDTKAVAGALYEDFKQLLEEAADSRDWRRGAIVMLQHGTEEALEFDGGQFELTDSEASASVDQCSSNPAGSSDHTNSVRTLYEVLCTRCHGISGEGKLKYPVLADEDWLYGGTVAKIHETIHLGRKGAMTAHRGILSSSEIGQLAKFVVSLSEGEATEKGWALFAAKGCTACHGTKADGVLVELGDGTRVTVGAANLTDRIWRFQPGGYESAVYTISYGVNQPGVSETRNAVMPAFGSTGVLSKQQIEQLVAYVLQLSSRYESLKERSVLSGTK